MNESEEKVLKRTAPQNVAAEKSVIACMLMDREAMEAALEIINPEDFYSRQYGMVFAAIKKVAASLGPEQVVDLVTVQEQLAKDGAPIEVQTVDFIREIYDSEPTSVNVRQYAEIVRNKAIQRRLITACGEISQQCYDDSDETSVILQDTEAKIFNLLKTGYSHKYALIEDVAIDVYHRIEKASQLKDHITGIPSGFTDLDNMTTGFQPSDFVLIAARPSMGKTAFVLNILEHVAIKKNRPCLFFSLEMSKEQLVNRLFSMDSGIDAQNLRSGNLSENDWARLIDTTERVGGSNIVIDDTPGITVSEMRSRCRKLKLERGLDLILIDYLQLMSGGGRHSDNRQQEVADISRALKGLAREMECPVIALSQLSRACEGRPDKRPMLSDLRDSGAIEQDADLVMFLYRDDYYNQDSEKKGEAEVIIAKQRNGPIGTVTLLWQANTTRFVGKARLIKN
ncbi:MAG: replicative DNA helicase [Lachnospiraceae bacterium]|nr:replicative DNA helicase [Lachnospiraceae bacterium]